MQHYLYALSHKDSPEFEQMKNTLSPADHVNLIMLLLPEACKNTKELYLLALSFHGVYKRLTDEDFKLFSHERVEGLTELACAVLAQDAGNECVAKRWKVFSTLFSIGGAKEVSQYLEREGLENKYCRYYDFDEEPTTRKQKTKAHIL